MDVFCQRLEDEYDANVIITAPTVPYKGRNHGNHLLLICRTRLMFLLAVVFRGQTAFISNPTEFPDTADPKVLEVQEPVVKASIIFPEGVYALLSQSRVSMCPSATERLLEYLGNMMDLCFTHWAEDVDHRCLDVSISSASARLS